MDEYDSTSTHWNEVYSGKFESDEYETEMHIPFIRRTVKIGFVGGDSETIEYDVGSEYIETTDNEPRKKKFCQIGTVVTKEIENKNLKPINVLTPVPSNTPEISVVPENVTYTKIKEDKEMVLVANATAVDTLLEHDNVVTWNPKRLISIEYFNHETVDEIKHPYPTEGAVPEYLNKIDTSCL